MFRRTALLVAALTAAATVLVAAPANAAAYGVSLSVSQTSADVGTTVTLSGKVTGKSSTGRTVYLQRQSGSTWSTVTTTKTTSKSTYSKAVKIPAAGTNSYRAVVKATSTVDRGQSTTRTVTGFTWVELYDAAYYSTGGVQRDPGNFIDGKRTPRETFFLGVGSEIGWYLHAACDQLAYTARASGNSEETATLHVTIDGNATEAVPLTTTSPARRVQELGGVTSLSFRVADASRGVLVASPRAHCSKTTFLTSVD